MTQGPYLFAVLTMHNLLIEWLESDKGDLQNGSSVSYFGLIVDLILNEYNHVIVSVFTDEQRKLVFQY